MADIQNETVSILIAEDSKTQAEILRHLLDKAGYKVRVAYNGRQALEEIQKELPTLVLTDVMMPEMNGYELCKTLKADPVTRNIPVILVTQLFDPRDVLSGLECGADNFIIKPYEAAYLLDRIKVILANRTINQDDSVETGVSVFFSGSTHVITSNRQKILNILLSTYEIAISKNNELNEAKDRLASVNDQLSDANNELLRINDDLKNEISERKRVELSLSQANKKLGLLSSITRHDMKNTMMALLSYNELAKMDSPDPHFQEYLEREGQLLSRLSAQIEFTRLYEELGVKGAVWIQLQDLIHKMSVSFTQIAVIVEPDVNQYEIFVDPLIEKVFYNLFDNALRHGEHVTTIHISACEKEGILELKIADDGAGVADGDKEQIFGRGYGKNTGLGLFLVREILSITDISIIENGKQGEGACFVLSVPKVHFRKLS
jgi:two-component system sensor histidine kinase/response regulator